VQFDNLPKWLLREQHVSPLRKPSGKQVRYGRRLVRVVRDWTDLQHRRGMRVYTRLLSQWLLPRECLRTAHRPIGHGVRVVRKRLLDVCAGASLHQRCVQLRRDELHRLLLQRPVRHLVEPSVRRRRRRLHRLRGKPGMQFSRPVRL
jgi:hypothetical protein